MTWIRNIALSLALSVIGAPAIAQSSGCTPSVQTNVVNSEAAVATTNLGGCLAFDIQGYYGPGTPGGGWFVPVSACPTGSGVDGGYCLEDHSSHFWVRTDFAKHPSLLDYGLVSAGQSNVTSASTNLAAFNNIQTVLLSLGLTKFYGDGLHLLGCTYTSGSSADCMPGTGVNWTLNPGFTLDMGYAGGTLSSTHPSWTTLPGVIEVDSEHGNTFTGDAGSLVTNSALFQGGAFLTDLATGGIVANMQARAVMAGNVYTFGGDGAGIKNSMVGGGQYGVVDCNGTPGSCSGSPPGYASIVISQVDIESNTCGYFYNVTQWPAPATAVQCYYPMMQAPTNESLSIESIVSCSVAVCPAPGGQCEYTLASGTTSDLASGDPVQVLPYNGTTSPGGSCTGEFWDCPSTPNSCGVFLIPGSTTKFAIINSVFAPSGVTAWFDNDSTVLNLNQCIRPGSGISGTGIQPLTTIISSAPCPSNNAGPLGYEVEISLPTSSSSSSPESVTVTNPCYTPLCLASPVAVTATLYADYQQGACFSFESSQGTTGSSFHCDNHAVGYYVGTGEDWLTLSNSTCEGIDGDYDSIGIWFDDSADKNGFPGAVCHDWGAAVLQTVQPTSMAWNWVTGSVNNNGSAANGGEVGGAFDIESGSVYLNSGAEGMGTPFIGANAKHVTIAGITNNQQTVLAATGKVLPNITWLGGPPAGGSIITTPWFENGGNSPTFAFGGSPGNNMMTGSTAFNGSGKLPSGSVSSPLLAFTFGITAPHYWLCSATDITGNVTVLQTGSLSATGCSMAASVNMNANDIFTYTNSEY